MELLMVKFRFLNIPVNVHPPFFLFLLFFTGMYEGITITGVMLGVILIASLLIHEYGHALTALYYGAKPEINLEAFGGNAQYINHGISPKQEFIITINGPLLESVLIIIPYVLLNTGVIHNTHANHFLYLTMKINIFWCIFNLLPVYPLDGGHITKYLLESKLGDLGTRISLIIGIVTTGLGCTYYLLEEYYVFGGLLLIYGFKNIQQYRQFRIGTVGINPFHLYNIGLRHLQDNEVDQAKAVFSKLLKSQDNRIRTLSAESLATILHKESRSKEAYKNLLKVDHQYLTTGKSLLCKLAFEEGNYSLVEKYARDIYDIEPSHEVALLNSKAFACLKDYTSAGGWLRTASLFENIRKEDLVSILQLNIYDQVRDHVDFQKHLPDNLSAPLT